MKAFITKSAQLPFSTPPEKWNPTMLSLIFHNSPHLDSGLRRVSNTFKPNSAMYIKSLRIGGTLLFAALTLVLIFCIVFLIVKLLNSHETPTNIIGNNLIVLLLILTSATLLVLSFVLEVIMHLVVTSLMSSSRELVEPPSIIDHRTYPTYEEHYEDYVQRFRKEYLEITTKWLSTEDRLRKIDKCRDEIKALFGYIDKYIHTFKMKKYSVIVKEVVNPFTELKNKKLHQFQMLTIAWLIAIILVLLLLLPLKWDKNIMILVALIIAILWLFAIIAILISEATAIADACQNPDNLVKWLKKYKMRQFNETFEGTEPGCVEWVKEMNMRVIKALMTYHKESISCLISDLNWDKTTMNDVFNQEKESILKESNPFKMCPSPTYATALVRHDTKGILRDLCHHSFGFVFAQMVFVAVAAVILLVVLLDSISKISTPYRLFEDSDAISSTKKRSIMKQIPSINRFEDNGKYFPDQSSTLPEVMKLKKRYKKRKIPKNKRRIIKFSAENQNKEADNTGKRYKSLPDDHQYKSSSKTKSDTLNKPHIMKSNRDKMSADKYEDNISPNVKFRRFHLRNKIYLRKTASTYKAPSRCYKERSCYKHKHRYANGECEYDIYSVTSSSDQSETNTYPPRYLTKNSKQLLVNRDVLTPRFSKQAFASSQEDVFTSSDYSCLRKKSKQLLVNRDVLTPRFSKQAFASSQEDVFSSSGYSCKNSEYLDEYQGQCSYNHEVCKSNSFDHGNLNKYEQRLSPENSSISCGQQSRHYLYNQDFGPYKNDSICPCCFEGFSPCNSYLAKRECACTTNFTSSFNRETTTPSHNIEHSNCVTSSNDIDRSLSEIKCYSYDDHQLSSSHEQNGNTFHNGDIMCPKVISNIYDDETTSNTYCYQSSCSHEIEFCPSSPTSQDTEPKTPPDFCNEQSVILVEPCIFSPFNKKAKLCNTCAIMPLPATYTTGSTASALGNLTHVPRLRNQSLIQCQSYHDLLNGSSSPSMLPPCAQSADLSTVLSTKQKIPPRTEPARPDRKKRIRIIYLKIPAHMRDKAHVLEDITEDEFGEIVQQNSRTDFSGTSQQHQ